MIVGAAAIELHIHGSQSLKAKRGVVRSIALRVRNRFNVSVAEVGGQGTWQRAELGLTAAGSEAPVVRSRLEKAVDSRAAMVVFVGWNPAWAELADHPRFKAIKRRIGLWG